MTRLRRFAYRWIVVPVGAALVRLVWGLARRPQVIGAGHLDAALAMAPSFIPVLWHQHQLFCAQWLLAQRPRVTAGFLVSPSVDGEIGAMLVDRFGGVAVRGSSSHTGARALRDYYEALVKRDISPIITPDGPRGPRFVFKPGAILLAQMSGRPMLPMAYAASRAILFHWDRFVIPLPFARIVIAIGAPRRVPRTLDAAGMRQWQDDMTAELRAQFARARERLRIADGAPE
ncbi:MAG: lysophospholipid acyltransferase family protein [Steroidobacteraceae bacterium]